MAAPENAEAAKADMIMFGERRSPLNLAESRSRERARASRPQRIKRARRFVSNIYIHRHGLAPPTISVSL